MASVPDPSSPKKPSSQEPSSSSVSGIPSDMNLVVTSLRLLDLDLLPDWPAITTTTFRVGKDAIASKAGRVRSAEWLLYRLFELWDPKETRTKLGAYFPALEPVQSIKLRGAFLQWLTSLKTAGILGRECALRKSLFDECKGEKFEEILFCFSTAVLQKISRDKSRTPINPPLAQSLAVAKDIPQQDEYQLQILQLLHQNSIRSHLIQRQIYRDRMRTLADTIHGRANYLEVQKSKIEAEIQRHESSLTDAGVDARNLKKQLRHDCTGDTTWLSIMLSGDSEQGRDGLVERPFAQIWPEAKQGQSLSVEDTPTGLHSELDRRVRTQQSRLEEWRAFQNRVSKRNEILLVSKSPSKSPYKSPYKSPTKSKNVTPMRSFPNSGVGSFPATKSIARTRSVNTKGVSSLSYARGSNEQTPNKKPESTTLYDEKLNNAMEKTSLSGSNMSGVSPSTKRGPRPRSPLKTPLPTSQHHRSQSEIPSSSAIESQQLSEPSNSQANFLECASMGSTNTDLDHPPLRNPTTARDESDAASLPPPESPSFQDSPTTTHLGAKTKAIEESPSNIPQTLSERTLQTLQQCQTSPSAAVQRRPPGHSANKSQGTQNAFNQSPVGPMSPLTPVSSRPGTAKTTSDASTTAGLNATAFHFPLSSPTRGSRPSSSGRKSPMRSISPTKAFGDSPSRATHIGEADSGSSTKVLEYRRADGSHTPPEQLFAEGADCASVFKSRSKLRHSPPGSPLV